MDQQMYSGDQQLQQSLQVKTKNKSVIKSSDIESIFLLASKVFKDNKKVTDVCLFVFFLANFILSIVNIAVKQEPLGYNITCNIISFISLIVSLCTLVNDILLRCCKKYKEQKSNKIKPENGNENKKSTAMVLELEDIEHNVQNQYTDSEDKLVQQVAKNELKPVAIVKQLAKKLLLELLLYPTIICSLYGLINEKQWQFDDALAGYNFLSFLFSVCMDAFYTKLKYIWIVQKLIISESHNANDKCKMVLIRCTLPCLSVIPHIFLLALVHWLIMAIIGVRIYIDNFSREINYTSINADNFSGEIDQANTSDTGGYDITPYTGYMIFCGFYLPVTSVIVYVVLNRAWFSDEIESKCEKILFFFYDPVAYIVVPFLMIPFIAFCAGIFFPDYIGNTSEYEVNPNAWENAAGLGYIFIVIFLLCNIRAALIFAITLIVPPLVIAIIFVTLVIAFVIICLTGAIVLSVILGAVGIVIAIISIIGAIVIIFSFCFMAGFIYWCTEKC